MAKTVWITGASRGIGRACAKAFAQAGYQVAIHYEKNEAAARSLEQELSPLTNVLVLQGDVADGQRVKEMAREIEAQLGFVDVLINNAGISLEGLFTDVTEKQWDRMFDVNVKGCYHCTQAVLPTMIREHKGCILNISSMWGVTGASCEVVYSATKAAIIGLTKALAKEVGPSGITVNCIAPGVIDTDMNRCFDEETMEGLKEETPLMRLGTGEDIARAALFLAGEGGSFITGQVLGVNGGFLI
jgi:3-oxoacyl-[acyl-carrier protein] reductase